MKSFYFTNRFSEISIIYVIVLLVVYFLKPDSYIHMTIRTSFRGWGDVRNLFTNNPRSVSWNDLAMNGWCTSGNHTSPLCACFERYYKNTYLPNNRSWNGSLIDLGNRHSDGILSSCLRYRPSWKKESCSHFCKVHILTPLLLCCLYLVCFYSNIVHYEGYYASVISKYISITLSLAVIVSQLATEKTGAIIATLSILSVLFENMYFYDFSSEGHVYWSFHRFYLTTLAVQAALVNEARDLIQVFSYGMLGFFAGLLSYMIYIVRLGIPCKHDTNICLHMWLGTCSILAAFIFMVEQSWFENTRIKSSLFFNLALVIGCLQCVLQTPFIWIPTEVNMTINFITISLSLIFVLNDVFSL